MQVNRDRIRNKNLQENLIYCHKISAQNLNPQLRK